VKIALRGFSHMAGKFTQIIALISLTHLRRPIVLENPALLAYAERHKHCPDGSDVCRKNLL
jgi:hypothetical protein